MEQVVGCCEQGIEPSGFVNAENFLTTVEVSVSQEELYAVESLSCLCMITLHAVVPAFCC